MESIPVREAVWRSICTKPQIWQCEEFLTSEECAAIRRLAKASLPAKCFSKFRIDLDTDPEGALASAQPKDAAVLRAVDRRTWALSGAPHEGEMPWAVHFTPSEMRTESDQPRINLGLHVDTNNGRERRHLTFLIYLNTIPPSEGGHTIFPLAELPGEAADQSFSEARPLGEMLLQATVQHTGQAWSRDTLEVQEAAAALLACAERLAAAAACPDAQTAPTRLGLAVAAKEGRCVAFWSRDSHGHLDAAAWHGGAAVTAVDGKWTLQKFREAPMSALKGCCIETFASTHQHLRLPCFAGGVRFVDEEDADVPAEQMQEASTHELSGQKTFVRLVRSAYLTKAHGCFVVLGTDKFLLEWNDDLIDEEEYALIKNLKETKQQYRDAFERHSRVKMDVIQIEHVMQQCKGRLVQGFEEYYEHKFGHLVKQEAPEDEGERYDPQEMFDLAEADRLETQHPDAMACAKPDFSDDQGVIR
ncbi:unnamed protein product [Cladocopium goreaui]|uniref:Kinesin-like protein KIF9 n=1 Tax=Cladocopium goreaui TaxID=2562237 RepID=A0A9P1DT11_9DINO|nr:unnamed protein product [Cladocopium goreaui]